MRKMQAEGGKAEGEAAPQAVSAEEMAAKMMSGKAVSLLCQTALIFPFKKISLHLKFEFQNL